MVVQKKAWISEKIMRKKNAKKATLAKGLIVFLNGVVELKIFFGSPTWIRTRDLRINSPSLYRLSYQGIEEVRIIVTLSCLVNFIFSFCE